MNKTPRTEAALHSREQGPMASWVYSNFARELETELNWCRYRISSLEAEIGRLRDMKCPAVPCSSFDVETEKYGWEVVLENRFFPFTLAESEDGELYEDEADAIAAAQRWIDSQTEKGASA